jgi:hypothetical protein
MKVYSGKVGIFRKVSRPRNLRPCSKRGFLCKDGPLQGQTLFLTDGVTAVFTVSGLTGKYDNGCWKSACTE